jgi:hypothetical protein
MKMYDAAIQADQTLKGHLAVTTWMGYDRPMDVFEAGSTDPARNGAGGLDSYPSGTQASHQGPPSIDTVVGHSYGSTLVGAAAPGGTTFLRRTSSELEVLACWSALPPI